MDVIFIKIKQNSSSYGKYLLSKQLISDCNCFSDKKHVSARPSKLKVKLKVDGIFLHYFIKELTISNIYRISFFNLFKSHVPEHITSLKFVLIRPKKEIIDYDWNYRLEYLVRERCELDHTFSWLSTLGGAFSALGDYYINCAEIAGKISLNQFKLALRLGDESIVARCKLFFSLSLIQRKKFKLAKYIVHQEYVKAKSAPVIDNRLIKMCLGIWSKLQYEHRIRNKIKKSSHSKIKIK